MQSPAEFSRDHQPAYVPATNRVLAGFLTMGVYALVLVVASHRHPAPNRASEIATRMEEIQQEARQEAFQTSPELVQEQGPQAPPQTAPPHAPQEAPPEMRRTASQTQHRQQNASPSLLERLFGPRDQTAAAPVPRMVPAPGPSGQSATMPSSGSAPVEQMASAAANSPSLSSAPAGGGEQQKAAPASGGQEAANETRDKPPPACQDAAWARAISNHVRRHFIYPSAARRQHATGVATAHLVIRRSGWLNELEITGTSGSAALDAAAYKILRKARPLPRIPERVSSDRIDLELPIAFGVAGDFKVAITNCGR